LDAELVDDLAVPTAGRDRGVRLGRRAAAAILAKKSNDGSNRAEPRVGVDFITATPRANGVKIRSVRFRWRSVPTGGASNRS
jgi:hypothetical protein